MQGGGGAAASASRSVLPTELLLLHVPQAAAAKAGVDLQVVPGLGSFSQQGPLQLGLQGEHQALIASLALQLAAGPAG